MNIGLLEKKCTDVEPQIIKRVKLDSSDFGNIDVSYTLGMLGKRRARRLESKQIEIGNIRDGIRAGVYGDLQGKEELSKEVRIQFEGIVGGVSGSQKVVKEDKGGWFCRAVGFVKKAYDQTKDYLRGLFFDDSSSNVSTYRFQKHVNKRVEFSIEDDFNKQIEQISGNKSWWRRIF
ncbi:hypothetical protein KJ855_03745 [Patescibacteria group bacterium]|nr:hypothetical protein [Patescibacteria group bacterium]